MSMSAEQTKELTAKLEAVLSRFGEENGVVVAISGVEFHTPEIIRNYAYLKSSDAIRFGEKASRYGLNDQDYGKEVLVNNKVLRLVDCCPNRHKYPFVVEDAKGKRWKISADAARKPGV